LVDVHRRWSQLLSLMDGAKEEASSVMVAATTCKPNHIGISYLIFFL